MPKYNHMLDQHGDCSCGLMLGPPSRDGFIKDAEAHFIETTTKHVDDTTGWKGLLRRIFGREGQM